MPHPPPSPPSRPPRLRPVQMTPQRSTRPAPDRAAAEEQEPAQGPEAVATRTTAHSEALASPPPESTSTRSSVSRSQYSVPFSYRELAPSRRREEGPGSQPPRIPTQAGASAAPQPFSSLDQAQGERLFGAWPPPPLLDGDDEDDPFAYDPPARPRRMSRTWPREGTGSATGSPGARASRYGTQGTSFFPVSLRREAYAGALDRRPHR